ncbi:MAG: flavin reductase family protein [Thermodesulfobacteria bacterium]|nr:flavin reductase family protein [Thermodesulfobacteriota bacterium]
MGLQTIISKYIVQGVYVITAKWEDKINGMTAAWVSQVSFKPRLLAVAIAPQRYTYELIKQSKMFCINVLGKDGINIAKKFGFTSGKDTNKFEGIPYKASLNGLPVLKDALAYFECEVYDSCKAGDHVIFLGEVSDYEVLQEGEPLIFRWEDYFGGVEG